MNLTSTSTFNFHSSAKHRFLGKFGLKSGKLLYSSLCSLGVLLALWWEGTTMFHRKCVGISSSIHYTQISNIPIWSLEKPQVFHFLCPQPPCVFPLPLLYCSMSNNSGIFPNSKSDFKNSLCSSCNPKLILGVTPAIDVSIEGSLLGRDGPYPACPGWATLQTWWL